MCDNQGCAVASDTAYCSEECRIEATDAHYWRRRSDDTWED